MIGAIRNPSADGGRIDMIETNIEASREQVKSLLKELFQFDVQDLDFGIPRIMNFKRKEIERFMNEDLIAAAEAEFKEYAKSGKADLQKEVDRLRAEIVRDFGEGTIDEQGKVLRDKDAPKIKEYLDKVREVESAQVTQSQIEDVFNNICEFFSRYYDKGDFLSKRRYGGREKYYVPYNGEEVLLHWANNDQYYIKTGEYFKKYSFRAGEYRVNFVLKEANVEQNNVKGGSKYFILLDDDSFELDECRRELTVFFVWRELVGREKEKYGTRDVQNAIVSNNADNLISRIRDRGLETELKKKTEGEITVLEKNLSVYVERNTKDYFVHKNLKLFLERELDFYLKNEVLDFDEITQMDEKNLCKNRAKIRAIKEISEKIIDFLAQVENFQRMMFEKRKFVLKTDYCVTLDRVPQAFYDEIGSNEKQVEMWRKTFSLDDATKNTFDETKMKSVLDASFLKSHKYLVVDTSLFNEDFKNRLVQSLDDLDGKIDGCLIKSENFQALNLLLTKYRGLVKSIYIDPPYNTGNDEFLYKDNFQHSSWLAMIFDRLRLAYEMLHPQGTIGVSIDNNELDDLLKVMDLVFKNRRAIITVKRGSVTGPKVINPGVVNVSEYLVVYSKGDSDWQPNKVYREKKRDKRYNSFIVNRDKDPSKWQFVPLLQAFAHYKGMPRNRLKSTLGKNFEGQLEQFTIENANAVVRTAALDDDKISKEARALKQKSKENPAAIFHFHRESFEDWYIIRGERILFYSDRLIRIGSKMVQGELITDIWDDTLPNDLHNEGGVTLKKGKKPEKLIGRFIELTTDPGDLVLDFFAGTGTACAAAQKMGRKWIGVDSAEFFDSLLVRRLENTLNGEQSGISSPNNWKGGGLFKKQTLEQFEDSLDNIVFKEKDKTIQQTLDGFQDYFLRYMLDYETRESPTRLLIDKFQTPFDYKIKTTIENEEKEQTVDLVETFSYLLGLRVQKIRTLKDGETTYRTVLGKRNNENIVIIWRNAKGKDLQRDKKFIEENVLRDNPPDTIFINGDSYIKNSRAIEPEFKRLIGA
ncbi:MAG TPA: site-specific DNA-methyltransferase [Candidatus Bathyarchaeia archaeon]|nr:site-specific DNA-methyltransferase [Candidatus Bathyarchaeia archaeon]